jgi:hypothetical protein
MKYSLAVAALSVLLISSTDYSEAQSSAPSIVGVWKITSFVRKDVDSGKTSMPYGEKPTGYRMHTSGGYVSYLFAASDRKTAAGSMTDADRAQFFNTMTAAVGTYKIETDNVLFHVDEATNPGFVGQNLTYKFKIDGQKLSMATTIKSATGGEVEFLSTYERAE